MQAAVPALLLRQEVFRQDLIGEPLEAVQLANFAQQEGGGVRSWAGAAAVRKWARDSCEGHTIEDPRHGPFPLLFRPDGTPVELPRGQRVAVVRIRAGHKGPGRAPRGGEWLFCKVRPLIDPAHVASLQRINRLGGHVECDPATGKPEIGALFRDAQTGQMCFASTEQLASDCEAFNIDFDSILADIVAPSAGMWRPPTTDPDTIRAEIARRLG